MPPTPARIEYRNASNQLVAEAYGSADGVTLAVYSGGGQTAYLQVNPQGRIDLLAGSFAIQITDTGMELAGGLTVGGTITFPFLPTADPLVAGVLWNDGGTVKVSAG